MMRRYTLRVSVDQKILKLSARSEGEGDRILLLHGLMHSSEIWDRVTPKLVDNYYVVAIDLPGFGSSPPLHPSQMNLETYARVVQSILEELTHEGPIALIVADSLSTVLVCLACQSSPLVSRSRLLLSGCPFDGIPSLLKFLQISALMKPSLQILRSLPWGLQHVAIDLFSRYTIHNNAVLENEIAHGVIQSDPATAARMFDALKNPMPRGRIECLSRNQGCILLRGRFDRVARRSTVQKVAALINARYVELLSSGHTPMIEEPEKYAEAIRELM